MISVVDEDSITLNKGHIKVRVIQQWMNDNKRGGNDECTITRDAVQTMSRY